jgi:hypothetical protein
VHAAGGRLKKLAARDPAAVIEGLGDARLACRIQSANALHAIIGDAFDVDPWSDSAALHDAMAVWRGKLAQSPAATPELENKAR